MEKISFNVGKEFCDECSLAVRRFIGHMEGVDSIDVEREGKLPSVLTSQKLMWKNLRR